MVNINEQLKFKQIEDWIDELGLKPIRTSAPVQRLKRIRFLGTMPYITELKFDYDRYKHSLEVAKLADAMGVQARLNQDQRKSLVLMALLHDIGHLPFSHASEVFFRHIWDRYHTSHGIRLSNYIVKQLKIEGDEKLAVEVRSAVDYLSGRNLKGNSYSRENHIMYAIFHSSLSADTLDGICKAATSIGLSAPDPFEIISSIYYEDKKLFVEENYQQLVEEFLRLKYSIYNDYVYSPRGLAAEAMLTRALQVTFRKFTEKRDFLKLDDNDTIQFINDKPIGRWLIEKLEKRDLFYSLREASPEKHKLIVNLFQKLKLITNNTLEIQSAIEKELSKQIAVDHPEFIIVHPTIKLGFTGKSFLQQRLFKVPLTLEEIDIQYAMKSSYGQSIEIVFPREAGKRIKNISLPRDIDVPTISKLGDYNTDKNEVEEKYNGSYFTPPWISTFICDWAIRETNCSLIDPASGEGHILRAAYNKLLGLGASNEQAISRVNGIEADIESYKASLIGWDNNDEIRPSNIRNEDFFEYFERKEDSNSQEKFDVILGNPPYIRSHLFQGKRRSIAIQAAKKQNVKLSELSSSWAPFVVCAASMLAENGRFGMVLPTELLWADYAKPVREYLTQHFKSLLIITFRQLLFRPLQQDVLILLANNEEDSGLMTIEVENEKSLSKEILNRATPVISNSSLSKNKWLDSRASHSIIETIENIIDDKRLSRLEDIADVSLGLVTGNNDYFLLNQKTIDQYKISDRWLHSVVKKATWIPGISFNRSDWEMRRDNNGSCYILLIPVTEDATVDVHLRKYLELGKRLNVDNGYKCRNRWPWYSIPPQSVPDAFLTYMSGNRVRLVLNTVGAFSTNSIHNVIFRKGIGCCQSAKWDTF